MTSIRASAWLLACCLTIANSAWAKEPGARGKIANVVTLDVQSCEGPAALGTSVHPRRTRFLAQGWMPFGDTGYRIDFARLGNQGTWTIAERLHDSSRGVDDSYALFSSSGTSPFRAAFVVTRMPPGEQMSANELLDNAVSAARGNLGEGKASFIKAPTPFGEGIEMIVGGRVGSACFPTSRFRYAESVEDSSIGISRFVVRGGDLLEYALTLPWPAGVPQDQMIRQAQEALTIFASALTLDSSR